MKKVLFITLVLSTCILFAEEIDDKIIRQEYQITNLENKVDNLESINQKLLNSVYVTIGTFSLLILAFIAVNVIAGIQTKKKEFDNIKVELENLIDIFIDEQKKILNDEKEQGKKEITEKLDKGLELSESAINRKVDKVISDLSSNRKEFLELANRLEKNRKWKYLSNLLEIIEIDLKNRYSYEIDDSLDSLIGYLKETEISIDDANDIKNLLIKIPDKFSLRKDKIEQEIKIEK